VKIYTGGGDRGKTSLFSGERVGKSDDRVEAYGEIDELNAILGVVTASLPVDQNRIREEIHDIQKDLMIIGALLATTPDAPHFGTLERIGRDRIRDLESAMDRMELELPPLKSFILPGGSMPAAWTHVARTICRRAERRIIRVGEQGMINIELEAVQNLLIYINRLSDYLFMLARYCNRVDGVPDIQWKG